jgi:hypothetical protein
MEFAEFAAVAIATKSGGQSRTGKPVVYTMEKTRLDETAFQGPFG